MNEEGNGNGRAARQAIRGDDERRPGQEDHAERARKRLAEIRALHGDDDDLSETFVDPWFAQAPPGWTYEWKTHSVFNKENPQYQNMLLRTGWSAVPAHRHRDLTYPGYDGEAIIRDGMILMERPKELTDRVRKREQMKAFDQVRNSEAKLTETPAGHGQRNTGHAFTAPKLSSHVGPVIPD
jgi:hypothetical protein